tara:strand:+ start:27 stop:341 length:315 start_codon:yes stop_codon:yes gene_type:complete
MASVFILLIAVMGLTYYDYIDRNVSLIITMVGLLLLLGYLLFYIVYRNYNRDKFNWDAHYFWGEKSQIDDDSKCAPVVSEEENEQQTLDETAESVLKNYTSDKK